MQGYILFEDASGRLDRADDSHARQKPLIRRLHNLLPAGVTVVGLVLSGAEHRHLSPVTDEANAA